MSRALRESRCTRRDSRSAWNATWLVTYFWAVLYRKLEDKYVDFNQVWDGVVVA